VIVREYESVDKGQEWGNSKETQDAVKIGEKYATTRDFAVEGLSQ